MSISCVNVRCAGWHEPRKVANWVNRWGCRTTLAAMDADKRYLFSCIFTLQFCIECNTRTLGIVAFSPAIITYQVLYTKLGMYPERVFCMHYYLLLSIFATHWMVWTCYDLPLALISALYNNFCSWSTLTCILSYDIFFPVYLCLYAYYPPSMITFFLALSPCTTTPCPMMSLFSSLSCLELITVLHSIFHLLLFSYIMLTHCLPPYPWLTSCFLGPGYCVSMYSPPHSLVCMQ